MSTRKTLTNRCIEAIKRSAAEAAKRQETPSEVIENIKTEYYADVGFTPHSSATESYEKLVNLYSTTYSNSFYPELRVMALSQWALESGWGHSDLAKKHFNFAGLKWRDEMSLYAKAVTYTSPSDGDKTLYCSFENEAHFIIGYWKFISRKVYAGVEKFEYDPEGYLNFIYKRGYAGDPKYVEKVLKIYHEHGHIQSHG